MEPTSFTSLHKTHSSQPLAFPPLLLPPLHQRIVLSPLFPLLDRTFFGKIYRQKMYFILKNIYYTKIRIEYKIKYKIK